MKDSVLVTGGAGFIGSHVAENLVSRGYSVVVLDDLSGGFERNVPKGATFVKGSVTDSTLLERMFSEHKFSYVFHLAAYAAEGLSHFIRKFNYENNLVGSINLINESVKNGVKHFVFTSSIAVYGKNQLPMREDLVPQPEDPYGVAKYAIELDLKAAHEMFGLDYTIFRPHNVYGERQHHGDTYRNVLGIFINNVMQGKPMPIFGDGKQSRAFSYIDDVAPYIAAAIETPAARNEVINIGADEPYNVLEIAGAISEAAGIKPDLEFHEARNEVVHAYSDHSKAKRIFGVKPATPLKKGIKKMVDWAKEIGPMEGTKFEAIEIHNKLPPKWAKHLQE